ncbi:hypothetical protein SK3146_00905 [Paenibacillus konkukensis]|uniref:Uncharacterized protein n=2 Tax=Paenibacillus TaxID=44249 RepID=A0ABY4RJT1_9BACL|nr:hypothetical protein SK3146_00905 [Paenibacillus konkukensis]
MSGDRLVGGVGVSGGSSTQDMEVANAAVQAFTAMTGKAGTHVSARIGSVQTHS